MDYSYIILIIFAIYIASNVLIIVDNAFLRYT